MKIENFKRSWKSDSQQVPRFATRCPQSCSVEETRLTTAATNCTLVVLQIQMLIVETLHQNG